MIVLAVNRITFTASTSLTVSSTVLTISNTELTVSNITMTVGSTVLTVSSTALRSLLQYLLLVVEFESAGEGFDTASHWRASLSDWFSVSSYVSISTWTSSAFSRPVLYTNVQVSKIVIHSSTYTMWPSNFSASNICTSLK